MRGLQDVVQEKAILASLSKVLLFNSYHTKVQEYRASPTFQSLPHAKDMSLRGPFKVALEVAQTPELLLQTRAGSFSFFRRENREHGTKTDREQQRTLE